MKLSWGMLRRSFLRCFVVSLVSKRAAAAEFNRFDPVGLTLRGFVPATSYVQRYRINATILLFGIPILRRGGVGGGYAAVEVGFKGSTEALALQFAAGSDPERAHGLNRFGILQEALVKGASTELAFAGLMTRSNEESFEQGRKALQSAAEGAGGILARGRSFGPVIRTWIDAIHLASDRNWTNLSRTLEEALGLQPGGAPREAASGSAATFLCAMREAALSGGAAYRCDFTHAGRMYRLETRRAGGGACQLSGTIHNGRGARTAEFSVTYSPDDESGIPVHIEYRPRSFLRLAFESELEANPFPVPSLSGKEGL